MSKYFDVPESIRKKITEELNNSSKKMSDKLKVNRHRGSNPQEETITGGFFHDIAANVNGNQSGISWRIDHHDFTKIQEKKIGADLAISVEVIEGGENPQIKSKSILVQCKKETNTDYAHAAKQAKDMLETRTDSRFAVFGEDGISVYDAKAVLEKRGNWNKAEDTESFGNFIGGRVLKCEAGTKNKGIDELLTNFFQIDPEGFLNPNFVPLVRAIPKNWLRLLISIPPRFRR